MTGRRGFPRPGIEMMTARREALDAARETASPMRVPTDDVLRVADYRSPDAPQLAEDIADRLDRARYGTARPGYALVSGLSAGRTLSDIRALNEQIFRAVWRIYFERSDVLPRSRDFRAATTLTADGSIPLALFGSAWSYKAPHADRNAILFSHVYGPARGFEGGDILIIDALSYLADKNLSFEDAFTWSEEADEQKVVLRKEHVECATREHGRNLGRLTADCLLFVDNTPGAGILHGASPVRVVDEDRFVREIHRCTVREDVAAISSVGDDDPQR
jgi:hypothetical protein